MSREIIGRAHATVGTLHEFLLAGARVTPERAAVVECVDGRAGTVTLRALERRATAYAAALDELGLDIGDRVLLESDTSTDAIAVLLACSSLGLTFVPVSPQTPPGRLRSVVEQARPALHLQPHDGDREDLDEPVGLARFGPDGLDVRRAPAPRVRHRREVTDTDSAYMVFTSGTTGRPKGVVMSHRGVLAFYRGMLAHGIVAPEDRVATTSPLQFDFSLLDIGLALGSGAAVVPVPRSLLSWPRRFLGFLRDAGVTQVDGVPSIWRHVLRNEPELLASLGEQVRGVLYSGEPFAAADLRGMQELLPHARIVNCFGSTESIACSFTDVPRPLPDGDGPLSIGFAHRGAELLLVDDDGRPVDEPGVTGEILLRSGALFTGYWDDPDATSRALVPDPLNPASGQRLFRTGDLGHRGQAGEMYFDGRADSQVKIRGNRVELGEVERAVAGCPGVASTAAVLLPVPGRDPALAVFVTASDSTTPPDEVDLKAYCLSMLPEYMVPAEVRVVDDLPVSPNGKIDRRALLARA